MKILEKWMEIFSIAMLSVMFCYFTYCFVFCFLVDLRIDKRIPWVRDGAIKNATHEAMQVYNEKHVGCYTVKIIRMDKDKFTLLENYEKN